MVLIRIAPIAALVLMACGSDRIAIIDPTDMREILNPDELRIAREVTPPSEQEEANDRILLHDKATKGIGSRSARRVAGTQARAWSTEAKAVYAAPRLILMNAAAEVSVGSWWFVYKGRGHDDVLHVVVDNVGILDAATQVVPESVDWIVRLCPAEGCSGPLETWPEIKEWRWDPESPQHFCCVYGLSEGLSEEYNNGDSVWVKFRDVPASVLKRLGGDSHYPVLFSASSGEKIDDSSSLSISHRAQLWGRFTTNFVMVGQLVPVSGEGTPDREGVRAHRVVP
jgi:hypothetical protein